MAIQLSEGMAASPSGCVRWCINGMRETKNRYLVSALNILDKKAVNNRPELREVFPLLDKDGDESTTPKELDIIHAVDTDNNGTIGPSGDLVALASGVVDADLQRVKEREAIDNDGSESGDNAKSRDLVANHDKVKVFESKLPSSSGATSAPMNGNAAITGSTFLETGDAADVWRPNNVQEEGKPETSYVFKMIRISPQDFNKKSAGYKISWNDFVRDLQARVSTWSQFDHPNVSGSTLLEASAYAPSFAPMDLFETTSKRLLDNKPTSLN
ncbi:unnamed protein product [Rhizoctonia solani]|uniref:EF-hand domain-containing protein n=1 Tax=Rhizoctonia solani TaxID=456999 RepID=A0A8H3D2R5_9AGAM|nr:unnamed protein product [Rhizoctonia solani]